MKATFCGHRELSVRDDVETWALGVTKELIEKGVNEFLLGGYGAFDNLAKRVLVKQKERYPSIKIILVIPYLNREYDIKDYDYTIYPELEKVPLRFAISKRNERMVDIADFVVAYVKQGWGGASKTLEYAKRKKKNIIKFPTE